MRATRCCSRFRLQGSPLFVGKTAAQVVGAHTQVCGIPPDHILDSARFGTKFFTRHGRVAEINPKPGELKVSVAAGAAAVVRRGHGSWKLKDTVEWGAARTRRLRSAGKSTDRLPKSLLRDSEPESQFEDLLAQMLDLDPLTRITPRDAIHEHAFLTFSLGQLELQSPPGETVRSSGDLDGAVAALSRHRRPSETPGDSPGPQTTGCTVTEEAEVVDRREKASTEVTAGIVTDGEDSSVRVDL